MTAAENRKRLNALRAEEAGAVKPTHERHYGPERRRQAEFNKRQMRVTA